MGQDQLQRTELGVAIIGAGRIGALRARLALKASSRAGLALVR